MKKIFLMLALMVPVWASGQWRVGVNGGIDFNHFIIDKHYMTDYHFTDRVGATLGLMGQYDVNSWLGVRAEIDWVQKNYRHERPVAKTLDYKYTNNYLQLPVMASFGFGGEKLRGFFNAGVYAGYWLNSNRKGFDTNTSTSRVYKFSEHVTFNSERDQRWDCGFVVGGGLEYRFARHWAVQAELRYYHSTTSTVKNYTGFSDPRYNATLALQAGVWYMF